MTIIFNRWGEFAGLEHAIAAAKKHSPSARVILIGDQDYSKGQCEYHRVGDYFRGQKRLRAVYRHRHHLPEWFSIATLSKWFVLNDFVRHNNISQFCAPDTDVLIFSDMDAEANGRFKDADYTISAPTPARVSQCPLFINNPAVLEDFCIYVLDCYRDFRLYAEVHRFGAGHISCLTFWNVFTKKMGYRTADTSEIRGGTCYDHNLCMKWDGFEHDGQTKVVRFKNGKPFILDQNTGQDIQFHILHCWGLWKEKMGDLMRMAEESVASD